MKIRAILIVACITLINVTAISLGNAQVIPIAHGIKDINSTKEYNLVDKKKRKQGLWIEKQDAYKDQPQTSSIGKYTDNIKTGLWYILDKEGKPISVFNYKKGVLDGSNQYFENGKLVCTGEWRGLNPDYEIDSVEVYDPRTGIESIVTVPSEKGSLMHGIWKYYNPNTGQLIKEEEYQVGHLIRKKEYHPQETLDEEAKKKEDDTFLKNKHPKKSKFPTPKAKRKT